MQTRLQPWRDYSGRISPLKLLVFLALFVPATWIAVGLTTRTGDFAARPLMEAIHQAGLWTIRLLMLALLVTPLRQSLQWPRLMLVRRMIGVAAFAYITLHFTLFVTDQAFDLVKVASEIVLRFYLTLGFIALLGLATLAATSTDAMMRRLGRNWTRLHRIIYGIGVLAVIHYFMQSKLDEWEPTILAGLFGWLLLYRVAALGFPKNRPLPLWALLMLALLAAALTAGGEAVFFWLTLGADPLRVLGINLSLMLGVRPSWYVLGAGLAVVLASALRSLFGPRPRAKAGAAPLRGRAATPAP